MLTFAVAVPHQGHQVDADARAALADPRQPDVPFAARSHLQWSDDLGCIRFGGWQDTPEGPDLARHWHRSSKGLVALTGDPWPRGARWRPGVPWAAQLASHLEVDPLTDGTDGLLGIFSVASLDASGSGTIASDPLGMGHLYVGRNDRMTVVSSRAALAARLLAGSARRPPRDVLGAGWLAFAECHQGLVTTFEDVKLLPASARIDIAPGRGASIVMPRQRLWTFAAPRHDVDQLVAAIHEDIATVVHRVTHEPVERRIIGLTGGRDSRTILAVAIAEGLRDQFQFQTLGDPSLPDVVLAKEIAATFGLDHHNAGSDAGRAFRAERLAALRSQGHDGATDRQLAFRLQVGMSSGMRNLMHPYPGHPAGGEQVLVSGYCGEGLRTNYPNAGWVTTREIALQFPFRGLKLGGAGILKREVQEHYQAQLHDMIVADIESSDAPLDVVDAWYLRNRFRRWIGPDQELNADNRVHPLYSVIGIRAAHAIGHEDRHADRIPFEVIGRATPDLLALPLQGGGWSERLTGTAPAAGERKGEAMTPTILSRAATATVRRVKGTRPPVAVRTVGAEQRQKQAAADAALMTHHFSDASNPFFEIADRRRVLDQVGRFQELPETSKRQLYGALTAAIWLGGEELTSTGGPDG